METVSLSHKLLDSLHQARNGIVHKSNGKGMLWHMDLSCIGIGLIAAVEAAVSYVLTWVSYLLFGWYSNAPFEYFAMWANDAFETIGHVGQTINTSRHETTSVEKKFQEEQVGNKTVQSHIGWEFKSEKLVHIEE